MADIFRNGRFEPDTWRTLADDEAIPPEGGVILSLARFEAEREHLSGDNRPLGLHVAPGEAIEAVADDVSRFSVIALAFPSYTDGRNYSTARLLRERYGYRGELRAVGNVLIDQVPLMRRCGIDALVVVNEPTRRRLAEGRIPEVPVFYQPIPAEAEAPAGHRAWGRVRVQ
ncbi:DUF934 domain-containing protein [Segnochrobactrum spirostomi]|uniref:DUF934 domain-containing protein n=1 Tax=Segnochrobactrum spirostomi TaxID=2608987 RepID=A0A6A7Y019_9HYPH|nr:DUF934 domain-containing protein [Segnochrobactrum spirostomi]MQT11349.1 DUF934 domain-containing protein [Segnochrobactrum spirostomi]